MHRGACGRVGNAFPSPPGRKKNLVTFRLRRRVALKFRRYQDASRGSLLPYLCGLSERRCGGPPRPPSSSGTLLHTATRPPTALPSHETGLGSAVPPLATPPAPCFQSSHSGLRQVRFLRKLMPDEVFYMHVLCYLLKALKRYVVPAAIATCCMTPSVPSFLASRLSHGI